LPILSEKDCTADHVTVWRRVQRYAPEMERRLRSRLNSTNDSWRVDETYIRVKVKWVYLYRAVDSTGATIDLLPGSSSIPAGQQSPVQRSGDQGSRFAGSARRLKKGSLGGIKVSF
jgi:hypothetical protein